MRSPTRPSPRRPSTRRSSAPVSAAVSESVWMPRSGSVPPCSRRCWRCRCRWRAWAKCWASSAKSSKRAATSCATSRCPASPPRPTASARATCRNTPRRSGSGSRNTASATWRLSGRYGQGCRAIPSPRRNRNCTAWIRRSTTGASWSIPCWWHAPSSATSSTGKRPRSAPTN